MNTAASRRPALALALILGCQMMLMLDATVVNIALPGIGADLGFSPAGLSWVLNAYTLAFGGLLLVGGRIGDLFGRRRTLVAGAAAFSVASLLGGLADNAPALLLARAAQGAAAAVTAPSALALVATIHPEGPERDRALGLFTSMAAAGSAIGMVLGGLLTGLGSWRWTLFINVPVGLAVAALLPFALVETPRRPARFDLAGALTGTGAVAALVYAFIRAADHGWADPQVAPSLAAAFVLLPVFVHIERRAAQPVVPLGLFAVRNRVLAYGAMLLTPAAMFGVLYVDTRHLQVVRGYGPLHAGLAFLPLAAGLFAASVLAGRLLARHGLKRVAGTGLTLAITGVLGQAAAAAAGGGQWALAVPLALNGLGVGLVFMPLSALILSGVDPSRAGAASGTMQTVQQIGGALGLSVLVVTVYGAGVRGTDSAAGLGAAAVFLAAALVLVLNTRVGPDRSAHGQAPHRKRTADAGR
ncbi:MFS transporter [Streptomyces sp. HNM0663]|uniref:MFS transporter n=1 Tax=Streptomyces chengmaiensis TaxID=3040919 RepID=A0ABT6HT60_9ACTN|nr:MFS transporter [Streptomyces chengmaiensis]MDH2391890.1 MFS transporter [Streptomyces chengmaiensis]